MESDQAIHARDVVSRAVVPASPPALPNLGNSDVAFTARADVEPEAGFVVYPGVERYRVAEGVEAVGLRALAREVVG